MHIHVPAINPARQVVQPGLLSNAKKQEKILLSSFFILHFFVSLTFGRNYFRSETKRKNYDFSFVFRSLNRNFAT